MEEIICNVAGDINANLFNKIEKVGLLQKDVLSTLVSIENSLDGTSGALGSTFVRIAERAMNIDIYRSKVVQLKADMVKVNERCIRLQDRLNVLRHAAQLKHALVEEGPFWYRCTFKGGVRFREYPSSTAKCVPNMVIGYKDCVEIAERVFITGETSVYLHVKGTGWLFENKDNIHCLVRCNSPFMEAEDSKDVATAPIILAASSLPGVGVKDSSDLAKGDPSPPIPAAEPK
jgi:hypothetical protein